MLETDENWMYRAIGVAREAERLGEVPVGAVIVGTDGKILEAASNRTITNTDPTAHAEILALRTTAIRVGNYRLTGVTVYSTIEPCAMCAGALVHARVGRAVFAVRDPKFGGCVSLGRVLDHPGANHRVEMLEGVGGDASRELLQEFFRARRSDNG